MCSKNATMGLKGLTDFIFVIGKYFKEWLECHVKIEYTINSFTSAPSVYVTTNGRFPSIYDAAQEFYDDTKITCFNIKSHHVVLRSKEKKKLPCLSNDPLSYSGTLSIVEGE
jgi:hypothetical protein